jgi:phosphohistidine phosphatase SixA
MNRVKNLGAAFLSVFILIVIFPGAGIAAQSSQELWQSLRLPGHFALMRHALAPGTGDPPGFTLGKCQTQRNLSEKGRNQAERIGESFRQHGIKKARVFSSQWCRCRETAGLLGLGEVVELPFLNSFFREYEKEGAQTEKLQKWLGSQQSPEVTVLVTHQVNITALTGVFPASGEIIIVRRQKATPEEFEVVGTIKTD